MILNKTSWRIKKLRHKAKSVLLAVLDYNSAVCITEDEKEKYLDSDDKTRMEIEIPVSLKSLIYSDLEQLNIGSRPFVIPQKGYDNRKGVILDFCKAEWYKQYEFL